MVKCVVCGPYGKPGYEQLCDDSFIPCYACNRAEFAASAIEETRLELEAPANPRERDADTEHGMSSEELGAQFPKFFRPAEPEEVGERDDKLKKIADEIQNEIGDSGSLRQQFDGILNVLRKHFGQAPANPAKRKIGGMYEAEAFFPVRDERLEFEVWAKEHYELITAKACDKHAEGYYLWDAVQAHWVGWLARSERVTPTHILRLKEDGKS